MSEGYCWWLLVGQMGWECKLVDLVVNYSFFFLPSLSVELVEISQSLLGGTCGVEGTEAVVSGRGVLYG